MILSCRLINFWIKIKLTIHHENIQSLAIETYKAVNNVPGGNLSEFFITNNHHCNLRSKRELIVSSINAVFKG